MSAQVVMMSVNGVVNSDACGGGKTVLRLYIFNL